MSLRMSPEAYADFQAKGKARKPFAPSPVVEQPAAKTATQRLQAKGRLPAGTMNKTEARYAQVLDARKHAGEILWWAFESIKFKLAPNTHLTIDFAIMLADGTIQMHDVKGAKAIIEDDAAAKMKVARAMFPFQMFYAFPPKKGGDWVIEEVG